MKGKPLLPTLRIKKRYVVYDCVSDEPIAHAKIVDAIISSYRNIFGTFGLSQAGLIDPRISKGSRGLLKIDNKYVNNLKIAMAMIRKIDGKDAVVRSAVVSGVIKKAKLEVR